MGCWFASRHSDVGLVELGNEAVKEDDRAVLLEGGVQSASPKARSSTSTFPIFRYCLFESSQLLLNFFFLSFFMLKFNYCSCFFFTIFRFFTMEEQFLIDNRLTLRAM